MRCTEMGLPCTDLPASVLSQGQSSFLSKVPFMSEQSGVLPRDAALVGLFGLFFVGLFYTWHSIWVSAEMYSAPSIVMQTRGNDGSIHIFDDFREGYAWLRYNTPDDAIVGSWCAPGLPNVRSEHIQPTSGTSDCVIWGKGTLPWFLQNRYATVPAALLSMPAAHEKEMRVLVCGCACCRISPGIGTQLAEGPEVTLQVGLRLSDDRHGEQDGAGGQQHLEQHPHRHCGARHGIPGEAGLGDLQIAGLHPCSGHLRRFHWVRLLQKLGVKHCERVQSQLQAAPALARISVVIWFSSRYVHLAGGCSTYQPSCQGTSYGQIQS